MGGPTLPDVPPYAVEEFTADEAAILRRYVTNLDLPVFALVNLPERMTPTEDLPASRRRRALAWRSHVEEVRQPAEAAVTRHLLSPPDMTRTVQES